MRDCHSIVGLYTYQNRVPFAPSLRWVSCKERDRLPHEGANFHSSFVHYPFSEGSVKMGGGRYDRKDIGALPGYASKICNFMGEVRSSPVPVKGKTRCTKKKMPCVQGRTRGYKSGTCF